MSTLLSYVCYNIPYSLMGRPVGRILHHHTARNEEAQYFFTAVEIAEKIAEIGSGRRGKSKFLVQKTGVLIYAVALKRKITDTF